MSITEFLVASDRELDAYWRAVEDMLEQGDLKLPVLPEVVRHLLAMKDDVSGSAQEISDLIHRDLTLAGHVLRISNSVAYVGARQISSLNQAIVRLGRRSLIKIAVSITMQGALFRVTGYESEVKEMARHALAAGMYAQEIGKLLGIEDDELYMCGLMHEIGKPVLLQLLVEIARDRGTEAPLEIVRRLLETYHSRVGSRLAEQWNLPESVKLACLYCHAYDTAPVASRSITITYLASQLATWLLGKNKEEAQSWRDDAVVDRLNLSPAHLDRLFDSSEEVEETIKVISVN